MVQVSAGLTPWKLQQRNGPIWVWATAIGAMSALVLGLAHGVVRPAGAALVDMADQVRLLGLRAAGRLRRVADLELLLAAAGLQRPRDAPGTTGCSG